MKLYILVKDTLPLGFAMVGVAHSSLVAHLKWNDENPDYQKWLSSSFAKVVTKVTDSQFEKAKELPHIVITESRLDNQETCLVLLPAETYPKWISFLPLYKN